MPSNEQPREIEVDTVIIGAGIAGLWTLDEFTRAGRRAVLIENRAVAHGQTIWSQGILHSGLKYTLAGTLTGAAQAIRDLPERWTSALAGEDGPNLSGVRRRAEYCLLWRTDAITSRLGMIGARAGLKTRPVTLDDAQRPDILRGCPGTVARLDETVICPRSLAEQFMRAHEGRILLAEADAEFTQDDTGRVQTVTIQCAGRSLTIALEHLVITAGNGAAGIRESLGLDPLAMQVRPLRMTLLRGPLPVLCGHCVDGNRTRVTITPDDLGGGRSVWQIGGEVSELGHTMSEPDSIAHTRRELLACIPGLDLTGCEWSSYLAPRAEGRTKSGKRPENPTVLQEQNIVSAWPSKLVAAPLTADLILGKLGPANPHNDPVSIADWPAPTVAELPWDNDIRWTRDEKIRD